jgi:hypothetical protein
LREQLAAGWNRQEERQMHNTVGTTAKIWGIVKGLPQHYAVIGLLTFAGCMSLPIAVDPASSECVLVYPLLDARADKGLDIGQLADKELDGRPVEATYLAENFNIIAHYAASAGLQPNANYADLRDGSAEGLRTLHTQGEKYVLVLCLTRLEYGTARALTHASVEGFLVSPRSGRVLWRSAAKSRGASTPVLAAMTGGTGITQRMATDGSAILDAYRNAVSELMRTFPVLQKTP